MNERRDIDLLRDYANHGAEAAFEAVVSRHVGLVYHSALRQTGQPDLAQDIAQTVFTLLARKAARLPSQTVVAGWLVTTTRFVASRAVRANFRRRRRDEEAFRMISDAPDSSEEMEALLPLLDRSLAELREADRDALSLRYLEGRSFAEVAAALGSTEDAARKRVQRSLERLRGLMSRRGATVGASALGSSLGLLSSQSAPAGLAAVISGTIIKQVAGATALSVLTQSTLHIMKLTQWKTAAVVAGAIVLTSATSVMVAEKLQPTALPSESSARTELEQKVARLETENQRLAGLLAAAEKSRPSPVADAAPLAAPPTAAPAKPADARAGLAAFMDNPAMKKMMAESQRKAVEDMYSELADEFRLGPKERDEFFRLLADNLQAITDRGMRVLKAAPGDRDMMSKEAHQADEAFDDDMRDFLNSDADFARYKAFSAEIGDRSDLKSMQTALARIQQPLSSAQQKGLLDVMQRERKATQSASAADDPVKSSVDEERLVKEKDELQKRILAGAATILTPAQLDVLRQRQADSLQSARTQYEMQRSLFGAETGK